MRDSRLFLTALVALWMGCAAAPTGKVEGRVTLDGEPLTHGSVVFDDEKGITVRSNLAADGSYKIRTHDRAGLPPGTYRVAVSWTVVGTGETPLAGKVIQQPETEVAIPSKYASLDTSGLKADVKTGNNPRFDFALSSK